MMALLRAVALLPLLAAATGEQLSVCPGHFDLDLHSVDDVAEIELELTNLGASTAYISIWANDTFNDKAAEEWRQSVLSSTASSVVSNPVNTRANLWTSPLEGNEQPILSALPGESYEHAPTKFMLRLAQRGSDAYQATNPDFIAARSQESQITYRGSCAMGNPPRWGTPIRCQTPFDRAQSALCVPEIRYWEENLWEVTVPSDSVCTNQQVNYFLESLRLQVDLVGIQSDLYRDIDPLEEVTFFGPSFTATDQRNLSSSSGSLLYDPSLPPNERYYTGLSYPYTSWEQMNVSGHRVALANPDLPRVAVMVIDTMTQLSHPDLIGGWLPNWEEINGMDGVDDDGDGVVDNKYGINGENMAVGDPVPDADSNVHGTTVTSVISATPNNRYSVAGLAPHLRVIPCASGTTSISVIGSANCMKYALENAKRLNIRVINHSYSGQEPSSWEWKPHEALFEAGIISTAATSNGFYNFSDPEVGLRFPAGYVYTRGIHSIFPAARHDRGTVSPCGFSTEWIDYLVQGSHMVASFSERGDGWGEGTSFAAPALASIIGSMLTVNPRLTFYDIHWILRHSLIEVAGFEKYCKYGGYPDMARAINYSQGTWITTDADWVTIPAGGTKTIKFKVAPSRDFGRIGDVTKQAYITIYGQDSSKLTGVYKMGEVPVKVSIG
eukprot:Protomagalhaensia_sp_Gyna_25__426@NODE_11_length_8872_cov_78_828031_g7_i0_p1_GENE_NODE_11_length_8872_cov_78_828031_g7_i0NODE_11_length_8872_cov_78_828031_g7_i0_p1_ORF_typecomplete_len668_score91_75Peptidase_S8/PF00082_22/5_2e24DUF916/PF06030_12/1_5e02DUF916/PF06030_12/0_04fn3_5/PF06280_12/4_1e02fn3_5/PF06280_12/0_022BACON/PF13004_7/6_9e03BACON/PF13004_7/0_009Peptidase_M35/PF02102_15/9e02Peptidase_M35/PF02102_15/0_06Cubinding_MopE/PF11617_8/1_6_NODE_11_length_8872_cov_78_828031_g7_i012003203